VKPVFLAALLAAAVFGCGSSPGPSLGEPIHLVTGSPIGGRGCFTFAAQGMLVVDQTYGVAIVVANGPGPSTRAIVAWRPGFTGRRVGPEVAVVNPDGQVVATTGRSYRIAGGYVDNMSTPGLPVATSAFWACDFVDPPL
jgi:hypothetical protein